MKKKTIFMVAFSTLFSVGAMSYLSSFKDSQHVHIHEEHEDKKMDADESNYSKRKLSTFSDGKDTKYINITTESGIQPSDKRFIFNIAGDDIPSNEWISANFDFYYNNEKKQTSSFLNVDGRFFFVYEDCVPAAVTNDSNNYYSHYQIKAGTTVFSTTNANYVLEKDYNFWSTRGQNLGLSYIFQHGGNDDFRSTAKGEDIPSLKFTQFGGGLQDFASRFLFQPKYEETSASFTYDAIGWEQRCPIYIDKGNGYVLSADSDKSPIIWENGEIKNANEDLLFSLYFGHAFDSSASNFSDVEMSRSYYSFYIADGTLWGGLDRPFMIQGDYYFEIINNGGLHGFYTTPHDYEKVEAKEPTCTNDGNIEYYKCTRDTHANEKECFILNADGSYTSTTLEAVTKTKDSSKHVIQHVDTVDPITGQHGTAAHYKCSECGKLFSDKFGNNEITKDSLIIHDYVKHDAIVPTCTTDGNKEYYTCSACDKYFYSNGEGGYTETTSDDVVIKAGHTYGELIPEVAATETTHGTKAHYKCSACNKVFVKDDADNYVEVKEESLIIHNYKDVVAKASTCTEDGNKAYSQCTCCNKYFFKDDDVYTETTWDQIVIKAGHTYGELIPEVAATETTHGTKAHYKCSACNKLFVKDSDIYVEVTEEDLLLHNFVEVKAKAATCTEAGNKAYLKCTCCNKYYVKDVNGNLVETTLDDVTTKPLGHKYVKHAAVAKTCEKDGNIEYYTCSNCGKYYLKSGDIYTETSWSNVVIKASHTYTEVKEVAATETTHGTKAHYKCSACNKLFVKDGYNYVEVTEDDLVIHNNVDVDAKAATCTEDGNIAYTKCTCCGKYYVKNASGNLVETDWSDIEIKSGHTYVEIAEVAETETTHGTKAHYKCSACNKLFVKDGDNYVEVNEEALIIHNYVDVNAKSATCTEDGNIAYKKCTCCGKLYITDESGNLVEVTLSDVTTKALGHHYSDWKLDEENLKITRTCSSCNETETVDVNEANGFTYKVTVEPTTTSEGKATWTSSKYGTFTVTLPKLESKGCGGEIVTTSAILASLSLITISFGFAALSKKKKKNNN